MQNCSGFSSCGSSRRALPDEKPNRLILAMRSHNFRPIIRTVADVVAAIQSAAFAPVGKLRGGAAKVANWGSAEGALTWIDGETGCERFRVAIPIARYFSGRDQHNQRHEYPIESFDGVKITTDGTLELENNMRLYRVGFDFPRLSFLLSDTQKHIVRLLLKYLGPGFLDRPGYGEPIKDPYILLAKTELRALQPFVGFIKAHWDQDGPPPSRETIATTLETVFVRRRSRE